MTIARCASFDPNGESPDSCYLWKIRSTLSLDGCRSLVNWEPDSNALRRYWLKYLPPISDAKGLLKWVSQAWNTINKEVDDYLTRFIEFSLLVFAQPPSFEEVIVQRRKLLYMAMFGVLASEFKVSVNIAFAMYTGTEEPEPSMVNTRLEFFPRRLRVYLKHMCSRSFRNFKLKELVIINSLFQGLKKGLLPIRPDAIDQGLLKHKRALTSDPEVPDYKGMNILKGLDEVLRREFPSLKSVWSSTGRLVNPLGCHATVESSRSSGGQVGAVSFAEKESDVTDSSCKKSQFKFIHWTKEGFLDYEQPKGISNFLWLLSESTFPSLVGHQRSSSSPDEILINEQCYFTDRDLHESLDAWMRKDANRWRPLVQPSVVIEPLKGRIITKPRVGEYRKFPELQGKLWDFLQDFPQFGLTGRSVTEEDIWHIAADWDVGKGFKSGDFSGATDNLKGRISELILDFCLEESDISFEDQFLIKESFLHSLVDYSKVPVSETGGLFDLYQHWECTDSGTVVQTNGQLMGHLLSFPILCIANYIIFTWTFEFAMGKKAPSVLVNGDDILFICSRAENEIWKTVNRQCGFIPSLGKDLWSDQVAQINSVLFRISTSQIDGKYFVRSIDEVPYYNFGLLTMRGKGKTGHDKIIKNLSLQERFPVYLETRQALFDKLVPYFDRDVLKFLFVHHYSPIHYHIKKTLGVDTFDIGVNNFSLMLFNTVSGSPMSSSLRTRESSMQRAMVVTSEKTDVNCFNSWSKTITNLGLGKNTVPNPLTLMLSYMTYLFGILSSSVLEVDRLRMSQF